MAEVIYDKSKASSQSTVKLEDGRFVRAENVVAVAGEGGGGAGGDYLPLTGGTLTGPIMFSGESDFGTTGTTLPILRFNVRSPDNSVLEKTISVSPNRFIFFDGLDFNGVRGISPVADINCNFGDPDAVWNILFIKKLRNGYGGVLNVPEEGGTIARTEDIETAVGNISTALTAILGE